MSRLNCPVCTRPVVVTDLSYGTEDGRGPKQGDLAICRCGAALQFDHAGDRLRLRAMTSDELAKLPADLRAHIGGVHRTPPTKH